MSEDLRRRIPGVDALLQREPFAPLVQRYGHGRVVAALRHLTDALRARPLSPEQGEQVGDPAWWADLAHRWLADDARPSLRRAINATGVVLHTNLGRAPLAPAARDAMTAAAEGYSNLEFDLDTGRRGSRYHHCAALLQELTGAEAALVVNNAAAALVLALNSVAAGKGVAVSRGELVEIGGGFRIPEILERSGARLVEVGSTNRTRIRDYAEVLESGEAQAVLKVHRSNFRISGFTEEADVAALAELVRPAGVPLLYDLGSGLMADPEALGLPPEPRMAEALAQGADAVVVSGDKLLGGPQAGIIVGGTEMVAGFRANPLCRALRVDKVTLAGLEATLRLYREPAQAREQIPTLRMLALGREQLEARARDVAARLSASGVPCTVVPHDGAVGGGTYPDVALPSWAVALQAPMGSEALAAALRSGAPPVVGRRDDDRLLLDVRTVEPDDTEVLVGRVVAAWAQVQG